MQTETFSDTASYLMSGQNPTPLGEYLEAFTAATRDEVNRKFNVPDFVKAELVRQAVHEETRSMVAESLEPSEEFIEAPVD